MWLLVISPGQVVIWQFWFWWTWRSTRCTTKLSVPVSCCIFPFLSVSCVSLLEICIYISYPPLCYSIKYIFIGSRSQTSARCTTCVNTWLIDQIGTFKSPPVLIILQTGHTVNVAGSVLMNKPVNRTLNLLLWLIVEHFWYGRKKLKLVQ